MAQSAARKDRILGWVLRAAAALTASILVLIVWFLVVESRAGLAQVGLLRFFTDSDWLPRDGGTDGSFALAPMLYASLVTTAGALLLAGPLGILSAVFAVYFAPPLVGSVTRRVVEVLAGVPSVVFGFWGLVTLVPIVRSIHPPGPSLMSGIIILALMIVPTVSLLAQATFTAVPQEHLEGAAALGLSRTTTLLQVVLPSTRAGLGVALLLGTTRAIGETMAVLMVCGNVPKLSASLFRPARTLTANIALELGYATDAHRSILFVSGLLLMSAVLVLVLTQSRLKRRMERASLHG